MKDNTYKKKELNFFELMLIWVLILGPIDLVGLEMLKFSRQKKAEKILTNEWNKNDYSLNWYFYNFRDNDKKIFRHKNCIELNNSIVDDLGPIEKEQLATCLKVNQILTNNNFNYNDPDVTENNLKMSYWLLKNIDLENNYNQNDYF